SSMWLMSLRRPGFMRNRSRRGVRRKSEAGRKVVENRRRIQRQFSGIGRKQKVIVRTNSTERNYKQEYTKSTDGQLAARAEVSLHKIRQASKVKDQLPELVQDLLRANTPPNETRHAFRYQVEANQENQL